MIVETQKRDIQRSSSFEEKAMGLAVGSEAFVFNVLRKDLYSDPIGSLIREYTVNAQDEHRKYGKDDVPILIQVPNSFVPELHIRDYAGGLTEEQVFNFFGNYGASDKRNSNDAVGFFGLGCKSAFAYTDSYIVKSFKDGIEYTFNIYIDETEIGKVAKISEESTTEPNGIEIIVPVKTQDIGTFQSKVISTVRYFKTTPIIEGMDYTPNLKAETPVIKGEDWEFFGNGTPVVVMGEIPYPINYHRTWDNLESWESSLLQSNIRIYVGIGDVQVTASREALQMSEKTIATIKKKLAVIKDSMIAETQKAFDGAKNLIEAKTIWHKIISSSGYSRILNNCDAEIKWEGEILTNSYVNFDKDVHKVITYQTKRRNSDMIVVSYSNKFECNDRDAIYFDDTDKAQVNYKRRARTLLNNGHERVILIVTSDEKDLETFLKMSVKELASFNAVTPTKATSNRLSGAGVDPSKKAKHASKVFVLNVDRLKGGYSAASEVWDVKEVTNLKGVYIPIDRFKPSGIPKVYDLSRLETIIRAMENSSMPVNTPIYGIKKGMDTKGLGRFDKWVESRVKANKPLQKDYSIALASTDYDLINVSDLKEENCPDGSIAREYIKAYKELKKFGNVSQSKYQILKYFPVELEADKTVKNLSNKFKLKYPLLKFINSYNYNDPEVVKYIEDRESEGEAVKAASA